MNSSETSKRILPLEALRGLSAVGVIFHHFGMAFLPHLINRSYTETEVSVWIGSPLFLLINGKAMVIMFFVLSGYVLTHKGARFRTRSELALESSKRWFRLTPSVSLSLLISYLLFAFHLYHYHDVYALNGSLMFSHYGGYAQTERPAFSAFLYQALFGNTFLGEYNLNPVIWTMMPEFYGSIMVFILAFVMTHGGRNWFYVLLLLLFILLAREGIWFVPFLLGALGASFELKNARLGNTAAILLFTLSLYLCGFYRPEGWYTWLGITPLPELMLRVLVLTAGGFGLLLIFATDNSISRRFSGRVSRILGKTSFALYLVHLLILSSVSAWGYTQFGGGTGGAVAAAFLFIMTAVPIVYAISLFDSWWIKVLARWHVRA